MGTTVVTVPTSVQTTFHSAVRNNIPATVMQTYLDHLTEKLKAFTKQFDPTTSMQTFKNTSFSVCYLLSGFLQDVSLEVDQKYVSSKVATVSHHKEQTCHSWRYLTS